MQSGQRKIGQIRKLFADPFDQKLQQAQQAEAQGQQQAANRDDGHRQRSQPRGGTIAAGQDCQHRNPGQQEPGLGENFQRDIDNDAGAGVRGCDARFSQHAGADHLAADLRDRKQAVDTLPDQPQAEIKPDSWFGGDEQGAPCDAGQQKLNHMDRNQDRQRPKRLHRALAHGGDVRPCGEAGPAHAGHHDGGQANQQSALHHAARRSRRSENSVARKKARRCSDVTAKRGHASNAR